MIESFLETLSLQVDGMCDSSRVRSVCSALTAIPGVLGVEVSLETREAIVRYDRTRASVRQFRIALFAMGFESVRVH
jgi:copper chaperone CopZ